MYYFNNECYVCNKPAEYCCTHQLCDQYALFCLSCFNNFSPDLHYHNNETQMITIKEWESSLANKKFIFQNEYQVKEFQYRQIKHHRVSTGKENVMIDSIDDQELLIQGDILDPEQDDIKKQQKNDKNQQKNMNNNEIIIENNKIDNKQQYLYRLRKKIEEKSTQNTEKQSIYSQELQQPAYQTQRIEHQNFFPFKVDTEQMQLQNNQQLKFKDKTSQIRQELKKSVSYKLQKQVLISNNTDDIYKQQYEAFRNEVFQNISFQSLIVESLEALQYYEIKLMPKQKYYCQQSQNRSNVRLVLEPIDVGICKYQILIGRLKIVVFVKLINQNLPPQLKPENQISSGAYGSCFKTKVLVQNTNQNRNSKQQSLFQNLYCMKCVRMKCVHHQKQQSLFQNLYCMKCQKQKFIYGPLKNSIMQFAFCILAAAFEIGPSIPISFDRISAFKNAITWNMQYGVNLQEYSKNKITKFNMKHGSLNKKQKQQKYNQMKSKILRKFDSDISEALAKLHALKIVHRDIKFSNILWSLKLKKFVFCDFGLAHSLNQTYKEKSLVTEISGTEGYLYPQLQKIFIFQKNNPFKNVKQYNLKVNYYYNDLFACREAFNKLENYLNQLFYNIQSENKEISKNVPILIISKHFFQRSMFLDQLEFKKASIGSSNRVITAWKKKNLTLQDQKQRAMEQEKMKKYKKFVIKCTQISFKEIFNIEWRRGSLVKNQQLSLKYIKKKLQRFQKKRIQELKSKLNLKVKGNSDLFQCFQYTMRLKNNFLHIGIGIEENYNCYKKQIVGQRTNENIFFYDYVQVIDSFRDIDNKSIATIIEQLQQFTQIYEKHPQFIFKFDQIFFMVLLKCKPFQEDSLGQKMRDLRKCVQSTEKQDLLIIYSNAILEALTYKNKDYYKIKQLVNITNKIIAQQNSQEITSSYKFIQLQIQIQQFIKKQTGLLKTYEVIVKYANWYLLSVQKNIDELVKTLKIDAIQQQMTGNIEQTSELVKNSIFMFYLMAKKIKRNYSPSTYLNQWDQLDEYFRSQALIQAIVTFNKHQKQIIIDQIYQNLTHQQINKEDFLLFTITQYFSDQENEDQLNIPQIQMKKFFYFFSGFNSVVHGNDRTPYPIDKALRFVYICKLFFSGLSPLLGTKDLDYLQNIVKQSQISMCQNLSIQNCMKIKPNYCQKTHTDFIFLISECKMLNSKGSQNLQDICNFKIHELIVALNQEWDSKEDFIEQIFPDQTVFFSVQDWHDRHFEAKTNV